MHTTAVQLSEDVGTSGAIRGDLHGLIAPMHDRPLTPRDYFDGSGDIAGKVFWVMGINNNGQVFMEISDTW